MEISTLGLDGLIISGTPWCRVPEKIEDGREYRKVQESTGKYREYDQQWDVSRTGCRYLVIQYLLILVGMSAHGYCLVQICNHSLFFYHLQFLTSWAGRRLKLLDKFNINQQINIAAFKWKQALFAVNALLYYHLYYPLYRQQYLRCITRC